MGEWIRVEDRLPESKGEVLISYERYGKRVVDITCWLNGHFAITVWSWFNYEITHWMPLPEPPKEE